MSLGTGPPKGHFGTLDVTASTKWVVVWKTFSVQTNCGFGRKYSGGQNLGPCVQDSFQVDLKVCDCFNAFNMGISIA